MTNSVADAAEDLDRVAAGPAPLHSGRWLILALLTAAMAVSFVDRYALSMLIQPIKAELALSDTAIGLATGIAFSAFYATAGLVMARLADRGAHRRIIIGSLLVWSVMTALCGAAQNFWHLLLARFGVGAGEAGVAPASHAMISTLFPVSQRTTALAVFSAAGPLGILIAFVISAPLEAQLGWRWTFGVLGLPGLVLGAIFLATGRLVRIDAPRRSSTALPPSWLRDVRALLGNPLYRNVLFTVSALALLTFGQTQWLPAYMERSFALPRAEIGPMMAMTQGIGMFAGTLAGGVVFDWLAVRDERWRARLLLFCLVGGLPLVIGVYSVGNGMLAASLAGAGAFMLAIPSGQLWSEAQGAVLPEQRATGAALTMLSAAIIGLGLGPLVVGGLSDMFGPALGNESLRYALLATVSAGGLWMFVHAVMLGRIMMAGSTETAATGN